MKLRRKGFTIVELVIVIAVIAVLAAVLIPTFSNLIKKANESVDIQLVRNMNVILEQDEALNGKPADVAKVKEILAQNGIANPTPAYSESAFAWDSEENVIVLINSNTQKGVYPKEYEGVEYKSTWELLAGKVNVSMESLGSTLEEALENVEFGQTIVLSSDQELNVPSLPKNVDIDLNGNKLTLANGLTMLENSNVTLSNGKVESTQISVSTGATLTLEEVEFKSNGSCAIFPLTASSVNISNSTIISDCPIGTNYSDNTSRAVNVNITNSILGSEENPCSIGIMLITSGDVIISECTIYASDTGILNRAGNVTVKDTVINYMPQKAYSDTYFAPVSAESTYEGATPGGVRQQMWKNGSGGFSAPIVVGDFWAKHYSFDANCTLINVEIINNTEYEYPDVYLSQENYDIFKWQAGVRKPDFNNKVAGTEEIMKTTLTCDSTITWAVNPGKNDAFIDDCIDGMEPFADYSGFGYSNGTYGGVAVLYVDNVFVNGVEQAPGSISANPIPAN